MKRETFRCSCGSSAAATSRPPGFAVNIVADVRKDHLADGHREVDAREFARISARQRRDEERLLREAR